MLKDRNFAMVSSVRTSILNGTVGFVQESI